MKLSECHIGTIVQSIPLQGCEQMKIGHIVDLTINGIGETIPVVKWATPEGFDPYIIGRHHESLEKVRD